MGERSIDQLPSVCAQTGYQSPDQGSYTSGPVVASPALGTRDRTRDGTHNLGMCPDQDQTHNSSVTDNTPTTEPHQPGHIKRFSASLGIGEVQIKATMRYYFMPVRMPIIKKTRDTMLT